MNLQNRNYFIVAAVVLVAIFLVTWLFFSGGDDTRSEDTVTGPQGREGEAIDVVSDFYSSWLSAVRATGTDPYQAGVAADQVLSFALRERLESTQATEGARDPVLCQTVTPDNVRTKSVFENESAAEFIMLPSGERVAEYAVVTLEAVEARWVITDITCTDGESAPEREFSFEKEGNLLKSVPPPLDPEYWHLVFEENGQMGHTAPLFFNEQSVCIALEGDESVCDPDQFIQTKEVRVQGSMSETGVTVQRLEFLE